MKITNRWNGCKIFENHTNNMRETVFKALESGANLRGADLSGANLSDADLSDADLSGANLRGADLRGADLSGADLSGANLRGANLRGADLRGADLRGADLSDANLSGANLSDADLSDADLSGANLRGANLRGADLSGANLRDADLSDANLSGANLSDADLSDADLSEFQRARLSILPDEGDVIGWKKASDENNKVLVKLLIRDGVKRSNSTGRKCRAQEAEDLGHFSIEGTPLPDEHVAFSMHDPSFSYKKGKKMIIPSFDENRWNECAPGIHFFITRAEAEKY